MEGFGSDAAAHTAAPYASHDASFDGNEQLGSWGGVAEPTNGFGGDEATAIIGDGPARLNKISGTWGAPEPPRAPPPAPTPSPPPAAAAAAAAVAAASTPSPDPALRLASRDIWGQPAQPAARQPAPPVQPPSPPLSPVAAGANAPFALEGSEEQRRVDALCAGGGVKLAPNSSEMDAFAAACGGLRPEGVARALAVKIRGGEWREGYRAACVLEHVAKGRWGGCEAVAFAFASAETDALDAAAASAGSHELLRAKAAEAKAAVDSRLGGVANRSTNGPPAASNVPVAGGGGVDLFGLMGDGTTPAAAAAAAATSFDAHCRRAAAAAPPAAPAAFAPPPDLLGGFGDMSLGGGGAPAPASAPPAPAPGVDPFGGLLGGLSPPPPPVVQTGGAMFGGLNPSMMTAKPSSSRSPSSPTALNGKQSTYQQHKDAKAFDFVSDMLKKK